MTVTKNRWLAYVLSFVMAFTAFGLMGTARVNAAEASDVAFTVSKTFVNTAQIGENSLKDDEAGNPDSRITGEEVAKEFTADELEALAAKANVDAYYAFTQKGNQVVHVTKGIPLRTLISEAMGSDDVSSFAGMDVMAFDKKGVSVSRYSGQQGSFTSTVALGYFAEGAATESPMTFTKNAETDTLTPGNWTAVEPVLAMEYYKITIDKATEVAAEGINWGDKTTESADKGYRLLMGTLGQEIKGGNITTPQGAVALNLILTDISSADVALDKTSYTYNGKECKPAVTVKLGDDTLAEGADYNVTYANNTNAGTAKVTVNGTYKGTVTKEFKITQAKNPMKVTRVNKTYKVKNLKKKAKSFKAIKVSGQKGTVTYTAKAANAKSKKALKFNKKTGKITVKKKTKKGTYKMTITVTDKGNANYAKSVVKKTVTVKVKK